MLSYFLTLYSQAIILTLRAEKKNIIVTSVVLRFDICETLILLMHDVDMIELHSCKNILPFESNNVKPPEKIKKISIGNLEYIN